jgi:hypothetical protein
VIPGKDGLDDWLDREVRPLPPPAGTFELITKRARRRKLRKLAVTLTSAAAVAAAAVFAVPTVLALHLSPSNAGGVAAGSTSNSATPSPNTLSTSAATPAPSKTKSPSATAPAATSSAGITPATPPAGGTVPPNFQPTSVTFVSAYEGWTIGQAGKPGTCANADPTICTSMARTNDRGKTWTGVPAPSTKLVSGIRFLDGINGWAFGPQLWSTHNRGNTWTQVDTHGQVVIGLETGGKPGMAFAVFATCGNTTTTDLSAAKCTSYTLMATSADTGNWSPVSPATTGMSSGGNAGSWATIVLGNGGAWLLGPDGTVYSGPTTGGGSWRTVGKAPCAPTKLLTWVTSAKSLITSCSAQPSSSGGQQVATSLFSSGDGGMTWSAADTANSSGVVTSLSGSPNAPVILATTSGIDVRTSAGHEQQVAALPGGFSYVGMTGDNQGVAVPADASLHEIWMTYDGGLQWSASKVSA